MALVVTSVITPKILQTHSNIVLYIFEIFLTQDSVISTIKMIVFFPQHVEIMIRCCDIFIPEVCRIRTC